MITLEQIKSTDKIQRLIHAANSMLEVMGYTEHGLRHVGFVSKAASDVLRKLHYPEDTIRLAAIAGWVHDVGNAINRFQHGITGATLLFPLLQEIGMPMEDVITITQAVGNHEEGTGVVCSPVSAALIIADKIDAHRTRVRRGQFNPKDIHDRVNYAIRKNELVVNPDAHSIRYEISMDASSSIMEFMRIYLVRMQMCEEASKYLGCSFQLVFNGVLVNNHVEFSAPTEAEV